MLQLSGLVGDLGSAGDDGRICGQLFEEVEDVVGQLFVADALDAFVGAALGVLISAVSVAAYVDNAHAGAADGAVYQTGGMAWEKGSGGTFLRSSCEY